MTLVVSIYPSISTKESRSKNETVARQVCNGQPVSDLPSNQIGINNIGCVTFLPLAIYSRPHHKSPIEFYNTTR